MIIILYSWKDINFLTTFYKKFEFANLEYLVCSKRGYDGKKCLRKAKPNRNKGLVYANEKCSNDKNNHNRL